MPMFLNILFTIFLLIVCFGSSISFQILYYITHTQPIFAQEPNCRNKRRQFLCLLERFDLLDQFFITFDKFDNLRHMLLTPLFVHVII